MPTNKIKIELFGAILMVLISIFSLTSATYAWFVSNSTVKSISSTIAAKGNGFVLQIVKAGDDLNYGSDQALSSITVGHDISPSSTDDCLTWHVPKNWNETTTKVVTYQVPPSLQTDGTYTIGGKDYYAYIVGDYTVYTITNTGNADIYLDNSVEGGAIQVLAAQENGTFVPVSTRVAASLRVGIAINDVLKVVYAPVEPDGEGNDNNPTAGWGVVRDTSSTKPASYSHISGDNYIDQNGKNWAVTKTAEGDYTLGGLNSLKIAENVTSTGVNMKIYVWMEGTDSDCINSVVNDDQTKYAVNVQLAGIAN